MATTKEAIFICLDVGPSMRRKLDGDDDKSPLDTALECISWILQRRIFTESKDEIGLVLFGTSETNNNLSEDGQYENISVVRDLQLVDWDFVKTIDSIPNESVPADFVDALVVAMDALHHGTEGKKFAQKSIVMLSNLDSEFADDQIDQIIHSMKSGGIDFAAIGPTVNDDEDNDKGGASAYAKSKKTGQQLAGEKVMKKIIDAVDGTCLSLNEALPVLSFFSRRQVRPTPWKCNLEIGADIRIPICMFLKTKESKIKQSWKWMNAQDANAEINVARTFHKKEENEDDLDEPVTKNKTVNGKNDIDNDENDEENDAKLLGDEIDRGEVVKAYKYGTTLVPLDKLDIESVKYKSDGKSFQLLGFTEQNNIKRQYFMGDGIHVAFADSNDATACIALSAFVKAMLEAKLNGLVRYCYNARSSPRVGAIIPEIGENGVAYLVYVTLPFSEDCRFFSFPTLNNDRIKPTNDQLEAIDSLIESMDLTKAKVDTDGRRGEAFDPSDIVNPHTQYVFQCMQQRVLCPNEPLPHPSTQLIATISPLIERLNLAKPAFDSIKKLFKLEKVEKNDKRTAAEVFKTSDGGPPEKMTKVEESEVNKEEPAEELVIKISTVRPVEDFLVCLSKNEKNFDQASEKLSDIIKQFVFDGVGSQLHGKALQCLETLREKSIQLNSPGRFNRFISTFKVILLDKGKDDFWKEIVKKDLGLIYDEESSSSQVKKSEAEEFLKEEEKKNESTVSGDAQESEENLLDELE